MGLAKRSAGYAVGSVPISETSPLLALVCLKTGSRGRWSLDLALRTLGVPAVGGETTVVREAVLLEGECRFLKSRLNPHIERALCMLIREDSSLFRKFLGSLSRRVVNGLTLCNLVISAGLRPRRDKSGAALDKVVPWRFMND